MNGFEYFRFHVSDGWNRKGAGVDDTPSGTLSFFSDVFLWIDKQLAAGRNVLVHCSGGSHRSGTTGIAYCMYANNRGRNYIILE